MKGNITVKQRMVPLNQSKSETHRAVKSKCMITVLHFNDEFLEKNLSLQQQTADEAACVEQPGASCVGSCGRRSH